MAPAPDERWFAALAAAGARTDEPALLAFERLVAAHATPGRHHHDFGHASAVVDHVLTLVGGGDDWASAVLAAWYHDAVYEPTAAGGTNEGASAVLACQELRALGATHHAIGQVARLVALTVDHQPAPGDRIGAVLVDADLAILGSDAARYDRYRREVRGEYGHLADEAWTAGRCRFLDGLLAQPSIFTSATGRQRWEAAARANLEREQLELAAARVG
jgi:predicted metal-dependent HD superfamily phosphohydrolase